MLAETHLSLGVGLTIAAARVDFGTNCLLASPPNAIPFCFGELSSIRHFENAKRQGHNAKIHLVPGLDRDIDHVADLRAFCKAAPTRRSWSCLKKNRALERILAPCAVERQDLR
jgi:2-phospho-L-lactate guanylyltransferase